jgi:hypothetical protein
MTASRVTPSRREVTSSSQDLALVLEETPYQKGKIWSWAPMGTETKNDCAGEDHQKFTGLDRLVYSPTYITVSSDFKTPALFEAILT